MKLLDKAIEEVTSVYSGRSVMNVMSELDLFGGQATEEGKEYILLYKDELEEFMEKHLRKLASELRDTTQVEEKQEFIEAKDNDSHRYRIPIDKQEEFEEWVELPEEDEKAWEEPSYAERLDGEPLRSNDGYNQAIKDINNKWEELC